MVLKELILNGEIETKQKFTTESSSLDRMIKNTISLNNKSKALTASMYKGMAANGMTNILYKNEIRPLTPLECERLQTVPDDYTNFVSNTQRYKMLGNGWTIEVISHIFNILKSTELYD